MAQSAGPVEYRLHLCRGVRPAPNQSPRYDCKQCDGEVPVKMELWETRSISSMPSIPGPLWSRVVAPDRVICMGQIELNCMILLNSIAWNRTVWQLNWIFLNRTVFMLNLIVWNRTDFVCWTESLEIELFLHVNCAQKLNWTFWHTTFLTFNCVWTKTILIPRGVSSWCNG